MGATTRWDDAPAIVSATPAQTMEGFGASGAWWPHDLVNFDPDIQQRVADLLFGPRGIALSAYRYNIGGGGVGVWHPTHATKTFLVEPGVYDWSRDPGGRLFLRLAAERGVPVLVGFVNSAPALWTTNGESRGGYLQPDAEGPFATYLADVVAHFRHDEGVTLTHLSPMNEPDHRFEDGFQEGMAVPVEQRAPLVRAAGAALATRAPFCRLTADESSRAGEHFLREAPGWLGEPEVAHHLAALAEHRYDFPGDLPLMLTRDLAEDLGKPLWFTEICCIDSRTGTWGQQYDPTIASAVQLANMIWQGLTVANDAAFQWWVACSSVIGADPSTNPDAAAVPNPEGWNDGLLYYDPNYAENGNQRIYTTKRFYVLGNFSRYVRPGARRHDVTGTPPQLRVVAFSSPATRLSAAPAQVPRGGRGHGIGWTLVAINNGRTGSLPSTLRARIPVGVGTRLVAEAAVETSADRDLAEVELPEIEPGGIVRTSLPPQSVTTLVVRTV
jgi:O-glycosyl hydrolase